MSDMIWEILSNSQCFTAENKRTQVELATNLWHKQARLANLRLLRFRGRFIFLSPLSPLGGRLIATLTAAFIVGRPNSSLREGQSRPSRPPTRVMTVTPDSGGRKGSRGRPHFSQLRFLGGGGVTFSLNHPEPEVN